MGKDQELIGRGGDDTVDAVGGRGRSDANSDTDTDEEGEAREGGNVGEDKELIGRGGDDTVDAVGGRGGLDRVNRIQSHPVLDRESG